MLVSRDVTAHPPTGRDNLAIVNQTGRCILLAIVMSSVLACAPVQNVNYEPVRFNEVAQSSAVLRVQRDVDLIRLEGALGSAKQVSMVNSRASELFGADMIINDLTVDPTLGDAEWVDTVLQAAESLQYVDGFSLVADSSQMAVGGLVDSEAAANQIKDMVSDIAGQTLTVSSALDYPADTSTQDVVVTAEPVTADDVELGVVVDVEPIAVDGVVLGAVIDAEAAAVDDAEPGAAIFVEYFNVDDVEQVAVIEAESAAVDDVVPGAAIFVEYFNVDDVEQVTAVEAESVAVDDVELVAVVEAESVAVDDVELFAVVEGESVAFDDVEPVAVVEGESVAFDDVEPVAVVEGESVAFDDVELVAVLEAQSVAVDDVEPVAAVEAQSFAVDDVEVGSVLPVDGVWVEVQPPVSNQQAIAVQQVSAQSIAAVSSIVPVPASVLVVPASTQPPEPAMVEDTDADGVPDNVDACVSRIGYPVNERGCQSLDGPLKDVGFIGESNDLSEVAKSSLNIVAFTMLEHPVSKIAVLSYSKDGEPDLMREQARGRGFAVADYLIAKGVNPSRLQAFALSHRDGMTNQIFIKEVD